MLYRVEIKFKKQDDSISDSLKEMLELIGGKAISGTELTVETEYRKIALSDKEESNGNKDSYETELYNMLWFNLNVDDRFSIYKKTEGVDEFTLVLPN
ncbi:hypothetical protein [Gallaecimonas xiamenensis]|uniref:Uncharacterized protein n=1 Tax=Gallaecimonas xiamenensis 3-C-1 TaxID=745411 RepID=K2JAN1_9GAMM|nr:hypothetical protein [Gallaecimonas xiamenensis]EKE72158.1 hypothetical protein B3C1_11319 [Gallaecimonas xiamenensis 3-C-1]